MTGLRDNPEPPRSTRFEIALDGVTDADVGEQYHDSEGFDDESYTQFMSSPGVVSLRSEPTVTPPRRFKALLGEWARENRPADYNRIAASIAESRCERGLVVG